MLTDPAVAVRELLALGWRQTEIARAVGLPQSSVSGLHLGTMDSRRIAWPVAVRLSKLHRANRKHPARRQMRVPDDLEDKPQSASPG